MGKMTESIESTAGQISAILKRRGIPARQKVRVFVETLDDDMPMARSAERGKAFDFLHEEPEIYTEMDIISHNV